MEEGCPCSECSSKTTTQRGQPLLSSSTSSEDSPLGSSSSRTSSENRRNQLPSCQVCLLAVSSGQSSCLSCNLQLCDLCVGEHTSLGHTFLRQSENGGSNRDEIDRAGSTGSGGVRSNGGASNAIGEEIESSRGGRRNGFDIRRLPGYLEVQLSLCSVCEYARYNELVSRCSVCGVPFCDLCMPEHTHGIVVEGTVSLETGMHSLDGRRRNGIAANYVSAIDNGGHSETDEESVEDTWTVEGSVEAPGTSGGSVVESTRTGEESNEASGTNEGSIEGTGTDGSSVESTRTGSDFAEGSGIDGEYVETTDTVEGSIENTSILIEEFMVHGGKNEATEGVLNECGRRITIDISDERMTEENVDVVKIWRSQSGSVMEASEGTISGVSTLRNKEVFIPVLAKFQVWNDYGPSGIRKSYVRSCPCGSLKFDDE